MAGPLDGFMQNLIAYNPYLRDAEASKQDAALKAAQTQRESALAAQTQENLVETRANFLQQQAKDKVFQEGMSKLKTAKDYSEMATADKLDKIADIYFEQGDVATGSQMATRAQDIRSKQQLERDRATTDALNQRKLIGNAMSQVTDAETLGIERDLLQKQGIDPDKYLPKQWTPQTAKTVKMAAQTLTSISEADKVNYQTAKLQEEGQKLENESRRIAIAEERQRAKDERDKTSGGMSARSEIFHQRIVLAGNEAVTTARNIMELPVTSSRGVAGGRQQGSGLLSAFAETLTNKMTSQEVQDYNTMVPGLTRNLSAIESAGLAPSGSLTHQMEGVILKEGDTNITKIRKMAEVRQIVEKGLEVSLDNPKLSQAQRDRVTKIINDMKDAIPFTQSDITKLQREAKTNPKATLSDVIYSGFKMSRPDQ